MAEAEVQLPPKEQTRGLTPRQAKQLLEWINPKRVVVANGHSHLPQQDVRGHLIRIFGFGNFDIHVKTLEPVFEEPFIDKEGKEVKGRFNVNYKAIVQLTIRDSWGNFLCQYEDVSSATAQNQNKGDAHELAMKSAVSGAIKRCAINLGDQFGLSLYNKGQLSGLVKGTLVMPLEDSDEPKDIQADLDEQLSLGLEEDGVSLNNDNDGVVIGSGKPKEKLDREIARPISYSEETVENAGNAIDMLAGFTTADEVQKFYNDNPALHDVPYKKTTLTRATAKRLEEIQHGS